MFYKFYKVTGAGNDFILFDRINDSFPLFNKQQIQQICDRNFGIGADGILILSNSDSLDFHLNYFNSDGSKGMLCANGGRSSVYFYSQYYSEENKFIEFSCCGKIFSGKRISENLAELNLDSVKIPKREELYFEELKIKFDVFRFDTGSPHLVLNFDDLQEKRVIRENSTFQNFNFIEIANYFRNHPNFGKDGINVNIITKEKGLRKIRSFERGIEGETLACGTGILASAFYLNIIEDCKAPIEIFSKSNKKFVVNFERNLTNFIKISLIGHTKVIYSGEIEIMEKK